MRNLKLKQLGLSTLGVILLVLLVLMLFGAGPWWPHGGFGYGYGPSGFFGIILIVVVILLVMGKI